MEAVRGNDDADPAPLLDACWALLSAATTLGQVARFHRMDPHYAGVDVDSAWLHRNACALLATARTAVEAQGGRTSGVVEWAAVAGDLLGHRGTPLPAAPRVAGSAAEIVDDVFGAMAGHGWKAEGARIWTQAWLRGAQDASSGGPSVRVPVAGCFDGRGFLAHLCLYGLRGEGELVPHPETALQPLGTQLLGGLRSAWEPWAQSVCFTFGVRDASVPSWLPLEGTSLSGAAALGFGLLARGHTGDVPRLVVAQVTPDGRLEPVGHEEEKMDAALKGEVPSVVLAEDSQVRETCLERFRQSGQEVVRSRSLQEVLDLPVRTARTGTRNRRAAVIVSAVVLVAAIAGALAAISGPEGSKCPSGRTSGVTLVAAGEWSANEQTAFQSVLQAFCDRTGTRVNYSPRPANVEMAKYLEETRCSPPDVVMLAQPGLLKELARTNRLYALDREAVTNLKKHYTPASRVVGEVDGKQYGVYFKASNKSVWWYTTGVHRALVDPPATLEQLVDAARAARRIGVPWLAIGGQDGWPLTDLFENIYLRSAGPDMYDALAARAIRWDHPTVIEALEIMNLILGDDQQFVEGIDGALQTDWRTAVLQLLSRKAMTTFEGDFVLGYARAQAASPDTGLAFFDFPSINGSPPAVVGGGDIGVALTDKPAAQKLLAFLATPEAASVWAQQPGFTSPNQGVDPSAYPDDLTRRAARTLASTDTFRFDLSDQQPTAFGANKSAGMWRRFQEFLRNRDPAATARALQEDSSRTAGDVPPAAATPCPPRAGTAVEDRASRKNPGAATYRGYGPIWAIVGRGGHQRAGGALRGVPRRGRRLRRGPDDDRVVDDGSALDVAPDHDQHDQHDHSPSAHRRLLAGSWRQHRHLRPEQPDVGRDPSD